MDQSEAQNLIDSTTTLIKYGLISHAEGKRHILRIAVMLYNNGWFLDPADNKFTVVPLLPEHEKFIRKIS
jgi:hypothetical protein